MLRCENYTNIEQSKKLASILPLESADMRYAPFGDIYPWFWDGHLLEKGAILCWSLAALLDYLAKKDCFPEITYTSTCYLMDINFYNDEEGHTVHPIHFIRSEGKSLVDACYKMIIKLHEEKLL